VRGWLVIATVGSACSFEAGTLERRDGGTMIDEAGTADAVPDAPPPAPFTLTGARWLLPCTNNLGNNNCNCPAPQIQMVTLMGDATRWTVTVRVRGIMEAIGYSGGTPGTDGWYVGGNPNDGANNVYRVDVSSPPQHYWLNRGTPTARRSFLYDYEATLLIDGNATVTFSSSGQDTLQWGNYDGASQPMTIAGITGIPQPYDGQFAYLDVLAATPM
jgi:hypothetical protein